MDVFITGMGFALSMDMSIESRICFTGQSKATFEAKKILQLGKARVLSN